MNSDPVKCNSFQIMPFNVVVFQQYRWRSIILVQCYVTDKLLVNSLFSSTSVIVPRHLKDILSYILVITGCTNWLRGHQTQVLVTSCDVTLKVDLNTPKVYTE